LKKEPEFSAELEDIMEDISKLSWQKVIADNIKDILKREGFWCDGLEVIFPANGFAEIDLNNDAYQFDFEIWLRLTIVKGQIASGTCYGKGIGIENPLGEPTGELEINDMTVEIMEGFNHIKNVSGKEKVSFT
jgi:hypothetical protein